jgi:hypothetical protein
MKRLVRQLFLHPFSLTQTLKHSQSSMGAGDDG